MSDQISIPLKFIIAYKQISELQILKQGIYFFLRSLEIDSMAQHLQFISRAFPQLAYYKSNQSSRIECVQLCVIVTPLNFKRLYSGTCHFFHQGNARGASQKFFLQGSSGVTPISEINQLYYNILLHINKYLNNSKKEHLTIVF